MSDRIFDRETLLDLTVNVIPLGILLFFVGAYAFIGSFPDDPVIVLIQMSIIVLTGVALSVLTYFSGKAISGAENEMDDYIPAGYSEADAEVAGVPSEPESDTSDGAE